MKETFVISVGGSLIVPDQIDTKFLKAFRNLILKQIKNGRRFAMICGGGKTARRYQEASKKISRLKKDDIDWLGIHATRINAHLIKAMFPGHVHRKIIKNPTEKINFREKILIAAGWKPGFSTDYDAVILARNLGAGRIINMSNIDHAYSNDPKKSRNAKPITNATWKGFRKILPKKWNPCMNAPFDLVASKEAQKLGLEVVILDGQNMKNLEKCMNGKKFAGTTIR